jgi:hypothetical protein
LDRKRGNHSLAPPFSKFDSGFFFWRFVKDTVYHERSEKFNEPHDKIVRAAECVTNEMLFNTWQENQYHPDMCHITNGAHIETYSTHKKLCGVQHSKMYQFLQYTLWLKI